MAGSVTVSDEADKEAQIWCLFEKKLSVDIFYDCQVYRQLAGN